MDLYWNPWGMANVLVSILAWILAFLVLRARPDRLQNQLLAGVMALEGILLFGGGGLLYLTNDARTAYASQLLNVAAWGPYFAGYLAFLATLQTRLTRPLRTWPASAVFVAMAVVVPVLFVVLRPDWVIHGVTATWYSHWEVMWAPLIRLLAWGFLAVYFAGLLVALEMWLNAPRGTERRRQGSAFALAFGTRDVAWGLAILFGTYWRHVRSLETASLALHTLGTLLFVLFTAYGILRTQLFDIDLKLKWGIQRGTLVGIFLAVFFVVGVIAENWLTQEYGLAIGGIAAGLLLFTLNPLQRMARNLADRAMPEVQDTSEYRLVRKRDVYLAALEGALVDGVLQDKERDMLVRLQDHLGLSATEARALEKGIVGIGRGG